MTSKLANIHVGITDHYDPEVQAMLMAMYSRSYGSIVDRLPSDEETTLEHKEKLGKFYVGYNHKSVGQLGVISVWLEGISQLAAKAVEDHPLFNGQESSTRYIDYSNQPIYSNNPDITFWQERWREFYINLLPEVISKIEQEFPFDEQSTNRRVYDNTVKARAFDICRGFLPAGSTTNVGFIGTFDTLNDHFGKMLQHPCIEMQDIAVEVLNKMKEKYPYGTKSVDALIDEFLYIDGKTEYFYSPQNIGLVNSVEVTHVGEYSVYSTFPRPHKGIKYPPHISSQYVIYFYGGIDFGSYRDLHRHRNGHISMKVLTPIYGFDKFYTSNIPKHFKDELKVLESEFLEWYGNSKHSSVELQYAVPMGYTVPVSYTCDLNQALYILELRSGKTVHNSLRKLIQDWAKEFNEQMGIEIHVDMDKENFTLKRGTQTFLQENINEN